MVILGILASSAPAWAQQSQTQMRSPKLAIAGLFVLGAGIGMVSAPGETYTVLGDDYCVTTYEVKAGGCSRNPVVRQVGFAAMAAGAIMTLVGVRQVAVYPTRTGATATYTVSW